MTAAINFLIASVPQEVLGGREQGIPGIRLMVGYSGRVLGFRSIAWTFD